MLQRFIKRSREKGIFIPLVAMMSVLLVGFTGLAVDSAFLYVRKQIVQNAMDVAALKGAQLLLEDPNSAGYSDSDIQDYAISLASKNIQRAGYTPLNMVATYPDPALPGQPSNYRSRITVTGQIKSKSFFVQVLPGSNPTTDILGASTARNLRLRVMLVLDGSSSMAPMSGYTGSGLIGVTSDLKATCDNIGSPLSHYDNSDPDNPTAWRLEALKCVSKYFVSKLKRSDAVGIVRFASRGTNSSTWSQDADLVMKTKADGTYVQANDAKTCAVGTNCSVAPVVTGDNPFIQLTSSGLTKVYSALSTFNIFGGTNTTQGLILAQSALDIVGDPAENQKNVLILVSDGAPHGFIPTFKETNFGDDVNDITQCRTAKYSNDAGFGSGYLLRRPDVHVGDKAGDGDQGTWQEPHPNFFAVPTAAPRSIGYGVGDGTSGDPYCWAGDTRPECCGPAASGPGPGHGCCTWSNYQGDNFCCQKGDTRGGCDVEPNRRRMFTQTILQAQKILDNEKTSIYSITLGPPDTSTLSPYGEGSNDYARIPMMAVIANDQTWQKSPNIKGTIAVPQTYPTPYPTPGAAYSWDFPCAKSGSDMTGKPNGKMYVAEDGASLVDAFNEIAEQRVSLKNLE